MMALECLETSNHPSIPEINKVLSALADISTGLSKDAASL
jgi:hypothetical protein